MTTVMSICTHTKELYTELTGKDRTVKDNNNYSFFPPWIEQIPVAGYQLSPTAPKDQYHPPCTSSI